MAFVVARPEGRFEIRESVHTPSGPRARSLAGFKTLTERVLQSAARRAQRPFDAEAVIASGRRAGAEIDLPDRRASARHEPFSRRRFVEASRRMANMAAGTAPDRDRTDPGAALIDLLGFADEIRRSRPDPPRTPLAFPVLRRLRSARAGASRARP